MATAIVSKPSKWFSNKTLKLKLPRLRSKSKSSNPTSSNLVTVRNEPQEQQLQQVFRHFDVDGDGKISTEELKSYFLSIGECMSEVEVRKVMEDFGLDSDNGMEYDEFVRLMRGGNDDINGDLKRAFEMYEMERGSGCITPRGLQRMLNRLGDERSYDECVAMIRVFDLDGNGVLDFHEFQQMMSCSSNNDKLAS